MNVAKRIVLKSSHHKKRIATMYGDGYIVVVIISQCIQILNHYVVHIKLIFIYVNYTSIKKIHKMDSLRAMRKNITWMNFTNLMLN